MKVIILPLKLSSEVYSLVKGTVTLNGNYLPFSHFYLYYYKSEYK